MDIGREFMEKTKFMHVKPTAQSSGEPAPGLEVPYEKSALISLPEPSETGPVYLDLTELIEQRRSVRAYSDTPLLKSELSYLLWCTQGIQKTADNGSHTLRNVPSAGARHAFETYILINRVDGLTPGLYRYVASRHSLTAISTENGAAGKITAACLGQGMILASAATFIWCADMKRMTYRYGQRGYRYIHLDAGHVCQNMYLCAEATGCGACAIAAFDDDALNEQLGLDGSEQFAVYVCTVGKKRQ